MFRKYRYAVEADLTVLGVDANYDDELMAAFVYRNEHVYPHFKREGFAVETYQGCQALRKFVAPAARKPNVRYVTAMGHGVKDVLFGQHLDVILRVGDYSPEECSGKIIHLLACTAAQELGLDLVRRGCTAFFGYADLFTYPPDRADDFLVCDAEIDRAFANGHNAREVFERAQRLFERQIAKLRAAEDTWLSSFDLEKSLCNLCAPALGSQWGDDEARLY
jgi:hypothetical protein